MFFDSRYNRGVLAYTPTLEFVEKKYADFDTKIHELEFNIDTERKVKWDGVTIDTVGTIVVKETEVPIYISGRNYVDSGLEYDTTPPHARIYSCSLYKAGKLVQNFIPAKSPDGVVGFWDSVSKSFFTSITGYKFIGG